MFRDILVCLDETEESDSRASLAIDLAMKCSAHLTALYVIPVWPTQYTMAYGEVLALEEIAERHRKFIENAATHRKAHFEANARLATVPYEFRVVKGDPASTVIQHGRYADLIIAGMVNDPTPAAFLSVPNSLVLDTGRPVLFVPRGYRQLALKTVLVAWKSSRQSARALNDALPLLTDATIVKVLSVNPDELERENPAADIALHLARHRVDASADHVNNPSGDVGDLILKYAAENNVDLIVAGAYGHTRFTELILGGVTRYLLKNSPLPLLMSH